MGGVQLRAGYAGKQGVGGVCAAGGAVRRRGARQEVVVVMGWCNVGAGGLVVDGGGGSVAGEEWRWRRVWSRGEPEAGVTACS